MGLGDLFGEIDHTYQKKAVKRLKHARNEELMPAMQASIDQYMEALKSYQEGFPGVMDEITAMGDASRQSAYEEFQQRLGAGQQGLMSRGLGNTTVRNAFEGGESSRYMRNLADINEGLAGLRSGVRLQGLTQQSGLMQQLGGSYERYGKAYQSITESMASADLGQPEVKGGLGLDQLFGIGQSVGGLFGGGAGVSPQMAAAGGSAAISGATAAMSLFSDRRLKRNIKRVGRVRGHNWYTWDWRDGSGSSEGVIAQEIAETRPDLVFERDGFLTVNYGGL